MYEIANSDCTGGIGKRAQTKAGAAWTRAAKTNMGRMKANKGGQAQKMVEMNEGSEGKQG